METFFWHLATPKFNCNTLFNNNPSFQSFHSFQNEQRLRPTFSILRHNYHFILQFFLPDYEMFFNIICCFRIEKNLSAQASFMVTFYFTKDVLEKGCIEQDEQLSSKKNTSYHLQDISGSTYAEWPNTASQKMRKHSKRNQNLALYCYYVLLV